jgi:hypothetical protein
MSAEAHHLLMTSSAITIRPSHIGDERRLAELVALDSKEFPPAAPILIGEVDGVLRAALSLRDGTYMADPFYRTKDLLALMRAYAAPQSGARRRYLRTRSAAPAAALTHSA